MDPFSVIGLTASLIGIAGLAETVVRKAVIYLKAVKDCEEEVRSLVQEINVLAGILDLLAPEDSNGTEGDEPTTALPEYLLACHNTLNEVKRILDGFEHKAAAAATETPSKPKKSRIRGLAKLSKSDLKWPLSKGQTMLLVEALSRHKSNCILALCGDNTKHIHQVLSGVGETNAKIDAIQEGQATLLQTHTSEEAKRVTRWLSPVNPADKHAIFRSEYQPGTGLWIFEMDEYKQWNSSNNSALFIYGIPGAGKTTIASLVIQTLSANHHGGMAYFYCRHDDELSQRGPYVLGSLLAQLSIQSQEAMDVVLKLYEKHKPEKKLPTTPDEEELGQNLQLVSRVFGHITLIIDGLDECGTGNNRARLIQVLSNLHDGSAGHIRILVFARPEVDINRGLNMYTSISIKAATTDLQLYVAARLRPLRTRSENLKEEIMDVLINHAEGMFQWVKCQVDYLLSPSMTDFERREALKSLPPNLTSTYVRILKRIESHPNKKTTVKVQRLLKWIILERRSPEVKSNGIWNGGFLTAGGLTHAISVEDGDESLDREKIPEVADIFALLSSLVKHKPDFRGKLQLSHFTVKEFLTSSESDIASESDIPTTFVHKYLVNKEIDLNYLVDTCLTYLSLNDFQNSPDRQTLMQNYPFYSHAALSLTAYLRDLDSTGQESQASKRFFTVAGTHAYAHWDFFCGPSRVNNPPWYRLSDGKVFPIDDVCGSLPLQYACVLALGQTCKRLREEGADLEQRGPYGSASLHLAINGLWDVQWMTKIGDPEPYLQSHNNETRQLRAIRHLVDNQTSNWANLASTTEVHLQYTTDIGRSGIDIATKSIGLFQTLHLSPLCLAITRNKPYICEYLLSMGASLSPTTGGLGVDFINIKVLCRRLQGGLQTEHSRIFAILQRIVSETGLGNEIPSIGLLKDAPSLGAFETNSLGILGMAILNENVAEVETLLRDQAEADRRHILLACQTEQWEIVSILHDYNVRLTDADYLSVYDGYPQKARKYLGPLEKLKINLSPEKVAQLFRDNLVGFSWSFPNTQEMHYLLGRLSQEEYLETVRRMTNLTTVSSPRAVRFMVSEGLLEYHTMERLLFESCTSSPTRSEDLNLETLKALIEGKINLKTSDTKGKPALHIAIESWFLNHIRVLLKSGASPLHRDDRESTALHAAVSASTNTATAKKIVKLLLSGVNFGVESFVGCQNSDGSTALHLASNRHELVPVLELLLEKAGYIDSKDVYGASALHSACAAGNHGAVRLLLKARRFSSKVINDQSDLHGSPLYSATCFAAKNEGKHTSIRLLLEAGADVNVTGHGQPLGPPLFVAALYGSLPLMRFLLHHGADILKGSYRYDSIIQLAKQLRRADMLDLLKESIGSQINIVTKPQSELQLSSETKHHDLTSQNYTLVLEAMGKSELPGRTERETNSTDEQDTPSKHLTLALENSAGDTPDCEYPSDSSSWASTASAITGQSEDSSYQSSGSESSTSAIEDRRCMKCRPGLDNRTTRFKNAVYRRRRRFKYHSGSGCGTRSGSTHSLVDD